LGRTLLRRRRRNRRRSYASLARGRRSTSSARRRRSSSTTTVWDRSGHGSGRTCWLPTLTPSSAWHRLSRRAIPIGQALLDQQILSGVGNVYRAEALFVNGIHPQRAASSLSRAEFDALWQTLASMLRQGVADRRIITVHPSERNGSADASVETIAPEDAFYVYKRDHCRRCGTPIRAWPLGPRRAYACERCQPPPTPPRSA
jgi:formamidopyrimidine-DNA glycosylase